MESREFEVMLLKEVKKVKQNLMIIPFQDLIYCPKLKIPRCISRTSITVDNYFQSKDKEITIYRYTTTLTFVLDDGMGRDDIVDIHKWLKNHLKNSWESNRAGKKYVIKEVSEIVDITDILVDGITQRYSIEITATIQKEQEYSIPLIKDVEMELN